MSKKVYIIHGWEGSPDFGWLYWLRKELNTLGVETIGLSMPHPELPTINDRVQALQDQIIPNQDTYIVAHSVGVQTALRWLQTLPEGVCIGGLVSVAGRFHLELSDEESALQARPRLETPIDTELVKNHCKMIVALFSDTDEWVPVTDSEEFITRLDAEVVVEHDMGHIHWLDPQKGYPLLKDIVLDMIWYDTSQIAISDIWDQVAAKQKDQVMIHVQDRDGTTMWSFAASQHESILDTAEKHDIDIGYSCRSGACFACACHVKQGYEHIDMGKFGYPLVDVDEGDCLTCIGGISDDARSGEPKEIIIKKF